MNDTTNDGSQRDAAIEAMARVMMESDGIASDYWSLATAAYDAALPLILGPLRELADEPYRFTRDRALAQREYVAADDLRAILDGLPGATS